MKSRMMMKYGKVVLTMSMVIGLVVLLAMKWNRTAKGEPYSLQTVQFLQAGIGAQAPCPTSSSNYQVRINGALYFMQCRSGVTASQAVVDKLSVLEYQTLPGSCNSSNCSRLTRAQVKSVITATFMNVLSALSDAQIDDMSQNSLRVFPNYAPPARIDQVKLIGSHGNMTPAEFGQMAWDIRSSYSYLRPIVQTEIAALIDSKLDMLAYACPDWNMSTYSPYQVYMLAYSLALDDHLGLSITALNQRMKEMETYIYNNCNGLVCPSEGKCAFGTNGYIYKTPANIFFSDAVQTDLLNRISAPN
ncbi:MAG: hypothetical protein HY231_27085 [Acidobacteria bacterium]|nr:hypothetical protein [Acidobacteriota bacterium]